MRMIILDNGHGCNTPGKRSPIWEDGSYLLEWKYCRAIVKGIEHGLKGLNIPCHVLVPEDTDIPLRTRVLKANRIAAENGISQTLLVSVHLNAAQENNTASGWEIHTSPGETKSDEYARVFWETAMEILGDRFPMRGDFEDGNPDRDSSFAIIRDTACPAVLTENLFMNTEKDCRFLMSEEGEKAIIDIHVKSIQKISGTL